MVIDRKLVVGYIAHTSGKQSKCILVHIGPSFSPCLTLFSSSINLSKLNLSYNSDLPLDQK
jgi:hypothetical protein